MNNLRKTGSVALAVVALAAGGLVAGCGDDSDEVDDVTAPLEDAAEDAGDAVEDAADEAGDAVDDAADEVEGAADDIEDELNGN